MVIVDCDSPLFVTWNLVSSGGGRKLRGCIGTFEALPLAQGLKSYALTAYVYCLAPSNVVHLMILDLTRFPRRKFPSLNAGSFFDGCR